MTQYPGKILSDQETMRRVTWGENHFINHDNTVIVTENKDSNNNPSGNFRVTVIPVFGKHRGAAYVEVDNVTFDEAMCRAERIASEKDKRDAARMEETLQLLLNNHDMVAQ